MILNKGILDQRIVVKGVALVSRKNFADRIPGSVILCIAKFEFNDMQNMIGKNRDKKMSIGSIFELVKVGTKP